jgi:hypothetical protein
VSRPFRNGSSLFSAGSRQIGLADCGARADLRLAMLSFQQIAGGYGFGLGPTILSDALTV